MTTSTPSSRRVDAGAEGAAALAERLGHSFADLSLLQHALAHRSWCGEQEGGAPSNERLEFLGDAGLGLIVAGYTYERFPDFADLPAAATYVQIVGEVAARAEELTTHLRKSIQKRRAPAANKTLTLYAVATKLIEAAGGAVTASVIR